MWEMKNEYEGMYVNQTTIMLVLCSVIYFLIDFICSCEWYLMLFVYTLSLLVVLGTPLFKFLLRNLVQHRVTLFLNGLFGLSLFFIFNDLIYDQVPNMKRKLFTFLFMLFYIVALHIVVFIISKSKINKDE